MPSDIIIRTSDNDLFKLHKVILAIASPVFGAAVTATNTELRELPSVFLTLEITEGEIPVLGVSQGSRVFDKVMRLCYPIVEPPISEFDELRDILEAATIYSLDKAKSYLKLQLESYLDKCPLRVYAIACRNNYEDVARAAANKCVGHSILGMRFHELEYINAAEYMRLLVYHKEATAKRSTSFLNFGIPIFLWRRNFSLAFPTKLPSSSLPYPLQAALPVAISSPPAPAKPITSSLFSDPGDIVVRSSDNVDFHLHATILGLASPMFKVMFTLPQGEDKQEPITIYEDSRTFEQLLQLCYPIRNPQFKTLVETHQALQAAAKYDMDWAVLELSQALLEFSKDEPMRVYAILYRHEQTEAIKVAARRLLDHPLLSLIQTPIPDEMEDIPAEGCFRALEYRKTCEIVAKSVLLNLRWAATNTTWGVDCWKNITCSFCAKNHKINSGTDQVLITPWFNTYVESLRLLIGDRPSGIGITDMEMLKAMGTVSCENCRGGAAKAIAGFKQIFLNQLENNLSSVSDFFLIEESNPKCASGTAQLTFLGHDPTTFCFTSSSYY
jgi:BTB/POZ domain